MGSGRALVRAARARMGRMVIVEVCILMGKRKPGGFVVGFGICLSSKKGGRLIGSDDVASDIRWCRVRVKSSFWSCFDLLEKEH